MFDVFQKEVDRINSGQLSCQRLQDEKVSDWFFVLNEIQTILSFLSYIST